MYYIELSAVPSQEFQVVLDDYSCTITLYQRGRGLYMDLEADGSTIWQGRICQDRQAIGQYPLSNFSGDFYFRDSKGTHAPTYDGFGDRYTFYYIPSGEDLPDGF